MQGQFMKKRTAIAVILFVSLIAASSASAQQLVPGMKVKTTIKGDENIIWTVMGLHDKGYLLSYERNGVEVQKWCMPWQIDTTQLSGQAIGRTYNPSGEILDRLTIIGGMKPISVETIKPHSGLILLGIGELVGSVFEFILAGNSDNSTVKTVGYVVGAFSLASGIGVISVSLQSETWATYSNGMQIRVSVTP
jgi:hypothetical protein